MSRRAARQVRGTAARAAASAARWVAIKTAVTATLGSWRFWSSLAALSFIFGYVWSATSPKGIRADVRSAVSTLRGDPDVSQVAPRTQSVREKYEALSIEDLLLYMDSNMGMGKRTDSLGATWNRYTGRSNDRQMCLYKLVMRRHYDEAVREMGDILRVYTSIGIGTARLDPELEAAFRVLREKCMRYR